MRKTIIIALAAFGLLILVLAVIPRLVDVNQYRGRIQAELQSRLGRPVKLGEIKLSFLSPSLQVQDVEIGEDPRFGAAPFAKAQALAVRVSLIPLLRKNVEIRSLRLINPEIRLILDRKGNWNYASIGPGAGSTETAQVTGESKFSLAHLEIRNGRVHVRDERKNTEDTYDNIDVTVKDYLPGRPFDVDAAVHVAGKGDQQIQVKGTAKPRAEGSAMIPFDGTVDLKNVSISDLGRAAGIAALNGYDGVLSGSLKAKTENGKIHSDGSLKIDNPQIQSTKLGYTITFDYALSDDLNSGVILIEKGALHLGTMPLTITGSVNTASTPAQIDMRLATQGASLVGIARLAAAAGVAFNAGTDINGRLDADIAASGAGDNPALNGKIRIDALEISGGEIKQPVSIPQIEIALTPSAISSSPFTAKTGSTQVHGQCTLKDYTGQAPTMQVRMNTENASVAELLSMARAYGASAVQGVSGSGQVSLTLNAAGPVKNPSAMEFSGGGALRNTVLTIPSLAKPLSVKNADLKFSQNTMTLENVSASLDQTNASGSLSIRNFASPQLQFALNIDKLDIAALQQIIATPPIPAKRSGVRLVPDAYAEKKAASEPGLLDKAVGTGTIAVGLLKYDQLVLTDVKSNVTLDHGLIRLSPLTSSLYSGQQTGEIIVDTRQNPASVAVNMKMQEVDGNKLLSSVSSLKDTIYGLIAANANASFRAGGSSNFAQSLNGQLSLDLGNGRLAKFDLLNQLAGIGKFLGRPPASQQPFTDVTKLNGNFNVVNGLAETKDLTAVIPGANLAARGTANLATNALNMHLTAVLSREFTQQVGGSSVGGFMQTALANSNGELVMPVLVTGTLDQPRFAPDLQEVARLKLQRLLPSSSGILGAILGGNRGQEPQEGAGTKQQAKPANPLQDLIDSIKSGTKKKEPPPPPPPIPPGLH